MDKGQSELYIGIDVGGTNIKAGIVDAEGNLTKTGSTKTAASQDEIMRQICELVEGMLNSRPQRDVFKGIGVAAPGDIDADRGIAVAATNLPWDHLAIARILTERFAMSAKLEKDTDAGAIGELLYGKAKDKKNVVYLALGTGVGGGLIINGQLYRGVGGAGEIGHMIAISDGPVCKCGTRGCLEAMASATSLVKLASKNGGTEFNNSEEVFAAAASGHEGARAAVKLAGEALASSIISVSRLLAPEIVVVGGGVSKAGPSLLKTIEAGFSLFSPRWRCTPVVLSETADWSGVLGASAAISMSLRG